MGVIYGDIFGCHNSGVEVPLESSGSRSEMLLNILESTGQSSTTKDEQAPKLIMLWLRNAEFNN